MSSVLAWTSHSANAEASLEEEAADVDEPPDHCATIRRNATQFRRAPLRRGSEQQESLLTKALQSHSEDDHSEYNSSFRNRRRSMASNVSVASTAEYTCDTGITTPARTSTPSPRIKDIGLGPFTSGHTSVAAKPSDAPVPASDESDVVQALAKKRCISFACAAKPKTDVKTDMPPPPKPTNEAPNTAQQIQPKRPSIRFACPAPPSSTKVTPPQHIEFTSEVKPSTSQKSSSPATVVDTRSPSASRRLRPAVPRRTSRSPAAVRAAPSKNWLTANARDLESESSRFNAFASDELQEDDWVRREELFSKKKLTIDACLEKEYAIRKLAREAEEEAELEDEMEEEDEANSEEDDEEEDMSGDDDEDDEDHEEDDDDEAEIDEKLDAGELDEERLSRDSLEEGGSDGYNTDNEVGFAESEDEDDDLVLWTTVGMDRLFLSGVTPVRRRSSVASEILSDSSVYAGNKPRRSKKAVRPPPPDLPDSTDFVCGTLDEDRPLEEEYMTRLTARRQEKLRFIPQDIDPSFPTSEPEDEVEDLIEKGHDGSDDNLWIHGDMEDIHNDRGRKDRRHGRKKDNVSPRRYHSPPPKPKRHHSPPPKLRGASPRRLFGQSPRRSKSPAPPQMSESPPASPIVAGQAIGFKPLASRPGLVFTKSLPRPAAMMGQMKTRRGRSGTITNETHQRGAIDIVKGLEEKRQRRKEKFYQKYCTRARKNPPQGKRPAPGQGAQRMREVGLTMAGKLVGPGNYVLSV